MVPQTVLPLTGEMSRSDKRVTARHEQIESVTHCRMTGRCRSLIFIATEKQFTGLFCLRQKKVGTRLCTATVSRNCVPLLRYTKQTTTPFGVVVCLCLQIKLTSKERKYFTILFSAKARL